MLPSLIPALVNNSRARCAVAVSYTHLDVYKRQRVDCKALAKLTGGTQFVNQADAGGVYNGQWIMATSRWSPEFMLPASPCPAPATKD